MSRSEAPAPNHDYWFIYCMWTFTQEVLRRSLCNVQGSQTFIKPNSWTGWESYTKWHMILEYPNEIKLKWGTIIVRTCTAATRSLFGFASVFFFSWIEYQLISWVICCSGNWVKGWEQTAHIQASHQEREDNKIVQFYSCFSLLCAIIELVAVQLMCINSTKIGKPLYIWHKSVATCKFTEIQTVERNNS